MTDTASSHTPGDPEPLIRDHQAIIDVATAAAEPHEVEAGTVVAYVVPAGGSVATIDRDTDEARHRNGKKPRYSKAGTTIVRDEVSLIELAARWREADSTVVYADTVTRKVVAVLDDDWDGRGTDSGGADGDAFGWRERRVELALVHTPEWKRWADLDGKLLEQQAFAEHIEACLEDIRSPAAADMLEIAQSLEATIGVQFASGVRLQSGQRNFQYTEGVDASAGRNGQLAIPETFEIAVTPWQGRDARPFSVTARLRFRVSQRGLQLGFVLVDVERILRTAFEDDIVKPIRDAGLIVVHGAP